MLKYTYMPWSIALPAEWRVAGWTEVSRPDSMLLGPPWVVGDLLRDIQDNIYIIRNSSDMKRNRLFCFNLKIHIFTLDSQWVIYLRNLAWLPCSVEQLLTVPKLDCMLFLEHYVVSTNLIEFCSQAFPEGSDILFGLLHFFYSVSGKKFKGYVNWPLQTPPSVSPPAWEPIKLTVQLAAVLEDLSLREWQLIFACHEVKSIVNGKYRRRNSLRFVAYCFWH